MYPMGMYQESLKGKILNAKPEVLMVMLYEGMLTRLKQAQTFVEMGNIIKARENIVKVNDIAIALASNLNFEEGGETAANLDKIYSWVVQSLTLSNYENDPTSIYKDVIDTLEPLYSSWKKMAEKAKA